MHSSPTPPTMPYTLWSKGRLLGHTDLGFIANTETTKMGWFHPTEIGERIMGVMTEPSRVILGYSKEMGKEALATDLAAAGDRIEALELELRSPEGNALAVKDIGINDTERLMALASDCLDEEEETDFTATLDEIEADVLHDLEILRFDDGDADEPWEEPEPFPRYQILVFL